MVLDGLKAGEICKILKDEGKAVPISSVYLYMRLAKTANNEAPGTHDPQGQSDATARAATETIVADAEPDRQQEAS